MKKILIRENANKANEYIENVESIYICNLHRLAQSIMGLGMGVATKDQIIDAISNNCHQINESYNEHLKSVYKATDGMEAMEATFGRFAVNTSNEDGNRFRQVQNIAEEFKRNENTLFNGIRIDNEVLFDSFDLNENGTPYLLESVKEKIRESVKEYCETEIGVEIHKLHQSLAKDIQKMYDLMALADNGETTKLNSDAHCILSYRFPYGLFDVKEDHTTGRKVFIPVNINFDPEKIEADESFIDDEDE